MLKGKEIAEISHRASGLTRTARQAFVAWDAKRNGEEPPEGSPILADSDTVAFYNSQEDADDPEVEPIFFDLNFHRPKKHQKWQTVVAPSVANRMPLVDSHAHIHMLPNPALAIARAGGISMQFLGLVTDPTEDGTQVFDNLEAWNMEAALLVRSLVPKC